jgi:formylglycine-generating enzyme required for sulfatase activity
MTLFALAGCSSPSAPEREAATTTTPAAKPADMVHIPAGEFLRGSAAGDGLVYEWEQPREQPQHPVYVDAFYLDLHEVTNVEFERFDPSHKRSQYSSCDECPVSDVSWDQAQAYCAARQPPGRLPTEAEWEKAAKGGMQPWRLPLPFTDYAWHSANSIKNSQPVMQKKPNGFGLYDMLGNVREWTADWYDPSYYQLRVHDNPKGPEKGTRRVERGGAFFLPQRGCTPTIRYNHPQHFRLYFLGFRCARSGS